MTLTFLTYWRRGSSRNRAHVVVEYSPELLYAVDHDGDEDQLCLPPDQDIAHSSDSFRYAWQSRFVQDQLGSDPWRPTDDSNPCRSCAAAVERLEEALPHLRRVYAARLAEAEVEEVIDRWLPQVPF